MNDLEYIKNGKKVIIEIKIKNKVIGLLSFDCSIIQYYDEKNINCYKYVIYYVI